MMPSDNVVCSSVNRTLAEFNELSFPDLTTAALSRPLWAGGEAVNDTSDDSSDSDALALKERAEVHNLLSSPIAHYTLAYDTSATAAVVVAARTSSSDTGANATITTTSS
uniref:Uncharacterized protein n=1 Tax=Syphacia muris TaxID=451379 RepID=A0A0N5ANC8_9BILA